MSLECPDKTTPEIELESELESELEKEKEKEPDINEKFTRFFSTFTNFTKKNQNRRAMSLQTFLELPSFQ